MSAGEVRDAIETITKVLSEQPQKGRSKNPPATAALKTAYGFRSSVRTERLLSPTCRLRWVAKALLLPRAGFSERLSHPATPQ
jgi:hypothetical protein